jgi:CheY-like chemotaxis protein
MTKGITTESYKPLSLLVIDDDEIDTETIKRSLKRLKLINPAYYARDGIEALNLLRNHAIPSPYIILLDINMPRMNGLEFLEALRSDQNLTHAIVFVLTTSKSDEDIMSAYREHVAGYLVKSRMDNDFMGVLDLLKHYWRIIELPCNKK